ncbi:hypothetical protein SAMN05443575_2262 [Jatrophihabitans endophyticus]|uniref:Uncharacterized protein n=1 Tax=Jatrophihabitans endophyticus TaxID=1206085 RepID=A0A1M5KU70_9ACTN|nr:hypothetical protein [Jatrophihabitans endophyticus]SHG56344.1 hypothetical protein SAMN05443575_2262 [Jatrophihabitans endophyticus]
MPLRPPDSARRRAARLGDGIGPLGPVGDVAALRGVGLDPVGEVLGCVASTVAPPHHASCGHRGGGTAPVRLGGALLQGTAVPFPEREQLSLRTAVDRLRAEVVARDADGAVGVTVSIERRDGALREVVLAGTAVWARSAVRPARPFLTALSAADVAGSMRTGWAPVDLHVTAQVAVRHEDADVEQLDALVQARDARRRNLEIPGFTDLTNQLRASVRERLRVAARLVGADGVLVAPITVHTHRVECLTLIGRTDRLSFAVAWGSSLARFAVRSGGIAARPVLPLVDVSAVAR